MREKRFRALFNRLVFDENVGSADESSAKELFTNPSTTFVKAKT